MILKLEDEIGCDRIYDLCASTCSKSQFDYLCNYSTLTTSFIMCVAMNCRMAQQPRGNCGRGWQNVWILGTLPGHQPWSSTGVASTGKGVFQAVLRQNQWGEDAICKQVLTRHSKCSPRRLRKQVGVGRGHRLELARLLWASHISNLTQKPSPLASWTRILQVTQSLSNY